MTFSVGCSVELLGLKSRPELNGTKGEIISFVSATGRWEVSLKTAEQQRLSLKPENLKPILANEAPCKESSTAGQDSDSELRVGAHVLIDGLQAKAELNGRRGRAMRYNQVKDRWDVLVYGHPLQSPVSLKSSNLCCIPQKFKIVSIDQKGVGVLSTDAIEQGELILAEQPSFLVSFPEMMRAKASGEQSREELLLKRVEQLAKSDQDLFWGLHDCYNASGSKTARGIFDTNAIATGEASIDTSNGLYLLGSRFNHSCKPNVIRVWIDSEGVETFHAARDIVAGEELCIAYQDVHCSKARRLTNLQQSFKFQCRCEACSLTGERQKASDMARAEYQRLDKEIYQLGSNPLKGLELVNQAIAIINDEYAGNPWMLHRTYYDGFQMGLAAGLSGGSMEQAKHMLSKAIENMVLCEGNHNNETMRKWRSWAVNPISKLSNQ